MQSLTIAYGLKGFIDGSIVEPQNIFILIAHCSIYGIAIGIT